MKWKIIIPVAVIAVAAIVGISIAAQGTASHSPTASAAAPGPAGGTSTVLPVTANPIANSSTVPGLSIANALAENNVDPATKQPTPDRLQFTLQNSSSKPLSGFEVFYTMTDAKSKQAESYYLPLTGLTVAAGAAATVYFDNQTGANHYPENTFSLYRSSKNQVDFSIEVSAQGVAVAKGTAVKGAGTGEVVGG